MEASVIVVCQKSNQYQSIIPLDVKRTIIDDDKVILRSNIFRLKNYLYDSGGSVKDGTFYIKKIEIIDDSNKPKYYTIGDIVLDYMYIRDFQLGDNCDIIGITLESQETKNTYTVEQFINIMKKHLEPNKETTENSTKAESEDFTLKEIRTVMHNILEPSEVEESMHEFVKYKLENTGIKIPIEEPVIKKKYEKIIVELTQAAADWFTRNNITLFSREMGSFGVYPKSDNGYYIGTIKGVLDAIQEGYEFIEPKDFEEYFINDEKWIKPKSKSKYGFTTTATTL